MRYARLEVAPREGGFHPLGESLGADVEITREAIHRIDLLEDGTCTMLTELRGDLDRYRDILAASDSVVDFAVAGETRGYSYLRFHPTALVEYLIAQRREMELVTEMPVEVTEDGAHRLTLIGEEEAFRRAGSEAPDGVDVELLETGTYQPDSGRLSALLTDRQLEVLEQAVDLGYYDSPRRATQDEVAAAVELSPGTVGEHLRKAEHRVFSSLV